MSTWSVIWMFRLVSNDSVYQSCLRVESTSRQYYPTEEMRCWAWIPLDGFKFQSVNMYTVVEHASATHLFLWSSHQHTLCCIVHVGKSVLGGTPMQKLSETNAPERHNKQQLGTLGDWWCLHVLKFGLTWAVPAFLDAAARELFLAMMHGRTSGGHSLLQNLPCFFRCGRPSEDH